MGPLLRSCAEVRAAIELSFGVVSGVAPVIHVLDGGPRASRVRGRLPHWPNGFNGVFCNRNVLDSFVKS